MSHNQLSYDILCMVYIAEPQKSNIGINELTQLEVITSSQVELCFVKTIKDHVQRCVHSCVCVSMMLCVAFR